MPSPGELPFALLLAVFVAGGVGGVLLCSVAARVMREARVTPPHRVLAAFGGAGLFLVVVSRFGLRAEAVPYLLLASGCVVLAVVDLAELRLPNRVLFPITTAFGVTLIVSAAVSGRWAGLLGALIGGVALFAVYLVLASLSPGAIGGGDVKLAFVLGAAAGNIGLPGWLTALVAAFVLNAAASIVALLLRRVTLQSAVPFGPTMIAGTFLALLLT